MAEVSETRSVETEADFPHPVDAVWRAMTDSEWLAVWFFPNDIRPVLGHKFTIWGKGKERWDGEFKCEIVALKDQEMLSFRWYGGHEDLKGFGHCMDTKATWTISPNADGGTHFHFLHEGFKPIDEKSTLLFEVMTKGSESVMKNLAKRLPALIEHGA